MGFRAVWDFAPFGTSRRLGFRAVLDFAPFCHTAGTICTCVPLVRSQVLYLLSYGGAVVHGRRRAYSLVHYPRSFSHLISGNAPRRDSRRRRHSPVRPPRGCTASNTCAWEDSNLRRPDPITLHRRPAQADNGVVRMSGALPTELQATFVRRTGLAPVLGASQTPVPSCLHHLLVRASR